MWAYKQQHGLTRTMKSVLLCASPKKPPCHDPNPVLTDRTKQSLGKKRDVESRCVTVMENDKLIESRVLKRSHWSRWWKGLSGRIVLDHPKQTNCWLTLDRWYAIRLPNGGGQLPALGQKTYERPQTSEFGKWCNQHSFPGRMSCSSHSSASAPDLI